MSLTVPTLDANQVGDILRPLSRQPLGLLNTESGTANSHKRNYVLNTIVSNLPQHCLSVGSKLEALTQRLHSSTHSPTGKEGSHPFYRWQPQSSKRL